MKTISILSQKGGSGKTTLSLHLASAATEAVKLAVVIDLDPQGSATTWYAARTRAGHSKDPFIQPTHPAQLKSILKACEEQGVDFVFIDTAPQSDNIAVEAARLSDLVLITCRPSVMDLRAISNSLRLADIAQVKPYIILTQIEPSGIRESEATQTLKSLNVDVLPCGTGKRVAYMDALIDGQTALEYEPNGKAATESRALYEYILKLCKKRKAKAA